MLTAKPMTFSYKNKHGGLTLIELMVALALLVILIIMGLPTFTEWIANSRVRTTAESIQNGLMLAKAQAVATNRKVEFVLTDTDPTSANAASVTSSTTGKNWVVLAQTPGTSNYDVYIQGRSSAEGGQNVTINSAPLATGCAARTATIAFTGMGLLTPFPAANTRLCIDISATSSTRPLRVTIDRGGAIRMCDPALSIANTTMGCP